MNLETLNESEYRKCAGLLAELLGLDGDTKETSGSKGKPARRNSGRN